MKSTKLAMLGLALAGALSAPAALAQANEQFIGLPSYRVGPYAAGGSGLFGGWIDYMSLVNERDGGINGVKLTWEECETEYNNARGVECYERLKTQGPNRQHGVPALVHRHHLLASSTRPPPTRFRSSRWGTAAPMPPTAACFPMCSRCSPTTGARTPPRSSSSA